MVASVQNGHIDCLKLLCSYTEISSEARHQAVYESALNGRYTCLNFLTDTFLPDAVPFDAVEDAIEGAASQGHGDCLKLLLNTELYNASSCSDKNLQKAIVGSIEGDHIKCLNTLYEKFQDRFQLRHLLEAMRVASALGRTECLRLLLDVTQSERPYTNDSYALLQSALIEAAKYGHSDCTDLLKEKTGVSIGNDPKLYSAHMSIATLLNNYNAVTSFLKLGASPDVLVPRHALCCDWYSLEGYFLGIHDMWDRATHHMFERAVRGSPLREGDSLLFTAVRSQSYETGEILLNWGANPNTMDGRGDSPLILAASNGNEQILKLLLRFRALPDLCHVTNQRTALEYAAEKRHTDCVVALLECGARADLALRFGQKYWPQIQYLFEIAGCYTSSSLSGHKNWFPYQKDAKLLQQLCRSSIRKRLVAIHPRSNLFHTIPKLPVPSKLCHFILYNS